MTTAHYNHKSLEELMALPSTNTEVIDHYHTAAARYYQYAQEADSNGKTSLANSRNARARMYELAAESEFTDREPVDA